MSDKIELKEKLAAVDLNVKSLWDEMDETQRLSLKNELFILNRYVSSVKTSKSELQEHYLLLVNEYFNKNWNDLQKHPKLLWMLLCMCGHESKQVYFHEWIGFKRKTNKMYNFLSKIYENRRDDEIEVLSKITTKEEAITLAKEHGMSDKEIAKLL